ncbi:MAG TPA: low molecular weight protein-tyrosine-phosphatase [Streptosporangiaceae bacterium]
MTLLLPAGRKPDGLYRVCLVCLGNICRSPMAEVVLRSALEVAGLVESVIVDSAGTGDWHVGEPIYSRARAALVKRGYDGSSHRSRQFDPAWFVSRDLILAMDSSNLADLLAMGGPGDRVLLFGEVGEIGEVPDPYGGSPADFDHVLDLLETAAPVVVRRLERLLAPRPA